MNPEDTQPCVFSYQFKPSSEILARKPESENLDAKGYLACTREYSILSLRDGETRIPKCCTGKNCPSYVPR